jgi:hypothetical protein
MMATTTRLAACDGVDHLSASPRAMHDGANLIYPCRSLITHNFLRRAQTVTMKCKCMVSVVGADNYVWACGLVVRSKRAPC